MINTGETGISKCLFYA